jgi:hypothetical protein
MKYLLIALFMSVFAHAEEQQYSITINNNDLPNFLSLIEKKANMACLDGVIKAIQLGKGKFTKQEKEILILFCQKVGSDARKAIKPAQ